MGVAKQEEVYCGSMSNRGKQQKRDNKRFLYMIPVILWMVFIFYMSARDGQGSSSLSGGITEKIGGLIENLRNDTPSEEIRFMDVLETLIRKLAHVAEYGILFGFVLLAVKKISLDSKAVYQYLLSFVICFLFACTDEFHQLFVPGRHGSIPDVGIDMCGVFLCMLGGRAIRTPGWRITAVFITAVLLVGLFLFLLFFNF